MKKFKIILIELSLIFCCPFVLAMEKSPQKINPKEQKTNLKNLNNLDFDSLEFVLKMNKFLKDTTIEIFEDEKIKQISFNHFKEIIKNKLEQKLKEKGFNEEKQQEIFIPNIIQKNELGIKIYTLKILKNKQNIEFLSCSYDKEATEEAEKLTNQKINKKFKNPSFKNLKDSLKKTNFLINNENLEIIEKNCIKKINFKEFENEIIKKLKDNFYNNKQNPIVVKNVIKQFNGFKFAHNLQLDFNKDNNQVYLKKIIENFELPFQNHMPALKTDMDKILIKENNYDIITKKALAKNSFFSKDEEELIKKTLHAENSFKNFLLILNSRIAFFLMNVFDFSKNVNLQTDNFSVIDASDIFHLNFQIKTKKINYPEHDYTPPIFEENDSNKHILTMTIYSPNNEFEKIFLEPKLIVANLKLSEKNKEDILKLFPNLGKTKSDYSLKQIEDLIAKKVKNLNLKPMKKWNKKNEENQATIEIEILYETYRKKLSLNVCFKDNGVFYDEFSRLKK